jgi:hypothetical protein
VKYIVELVLEGAVSSAMGRRSSCLRHLVVRTAPLPTVPAGLPLALDVPEGAEHSRSDG